MASSKLRCIKSLYKSTYRGNAFVEGKEYEIASEEPNTVYVYDEHGNSFNFFKTAGTPYYFLDHYFEKPAI